MIDRRVSLGWAHGRTADAISDSVVDALDRLRAVDGLFANWVIPMGTAKATKNARIPSELTPAWVRQHAIVGRSIPDNEDGIVFILWNGGSGREHARLHVQDRIRLPFEDQPGFAGLEVPDSLSTGKIEEALRVMVQAFAPEIGALTTERGRSRVRHGEALGPLVYLADAVWDIGALPPDVEAERVGEGGTLLRDLRWRGGPLDDNELSDRIASVVARR